ncbi:histidine kinase [Streptomyces sp. NPDC101455]|uniref:histidine kinase n=1 Tax=Streptomyces sp. NPDC101455 TaxID=3366142 RepID=UPI0037F90CA0
MIAAPERLKDPGSLPGFFRLTFAVGFGCYLRVQDGHRIRAMEAVRQGERPELARDLHGFVAHHVTGIVVHANAGRAIRATAPEQIDPILQSAAVTPTGGRTRAVPIRWADTGDGPDGA